MKKLLSIFLVLAMVLGFAACGDLSDKKNKQKERSDSQENVEENYDFSNVTVGDYVTFGAYEQDNDESNGKEKIEWLILEKQEDKILLISKYALDCKPFKDEFISTSWLGSSIKKWLSADFKDEAFTEKEQSRLVTITIKPDYQTEANFNDSRDSVFLLNINEVNRYFRTDATKMCEPTAYAIAQGCKLGTDGTNGDNCDWWLRSSGSRDRYAAVVRGDGKVISNGRDVNLTNIGVRPAMWVTI